MKKLLTDLTKVIARRKEAELEEKALKIALMEYMEEKGHEKEETDAGVFTIAHRPYYKYTDKVKKMEEKVKLAKIDEEDNGKAEKHVTSYILFKEKKD